MQARPPHGQDMAAWKVKSLSRVLLFTTPWTVAFQVPLSMGFSRQESGVGCHFLLQEVFPTQGLIPGLPHCRQMLYRPSHQGSRQPGNYWINAHFPSLLLMTLLSSSSVRLAWAWERPNRLDIRWGVQNMDREDLLNEALEKEMATHPSFLAWKIPWTEEPGRLYSTESLSTHWMKNSIAYNITSILIFTLDSNCMINIEYWGLTKSCFRALWRIYSCLARCVMWVYLSSLGDSGCCFEESNCWRCQLENAHESCKLSFIFRVKWGDDRETAFQIALRNCSKEVVGKLSIYVILVKVEYMHSSIYFLQKVFASHKEQLSPWRILVPF